MALKFSGDTETAQTIALKALGYLAADEDLLEPFLGATGLAAGRPPGWCHRQRIPGRST